MNTAHKFSNSCYTYYAFISYKRADSRWAEWLQKKLQSFCLPAKLCKKYPLLPKRLSPVFLDKENLTPGELQNKLQEELAASKFLIVICSRNTLKNPYYVNQEIRMFLDAGHSPEQIIPFIVDQAPQPELECFPPVLQEICQTYNLLGANIHEAGERTAFLKTVAYMHGLKLTEVESAEDRRLRRNRRLRSFCAASILFLLGIAGYFLWDYYVPKIAYYLDYTTEWGLPKGIHPLTKEEIATMQAHYSLITTKHDQRYELRYENSLGNLIDHTSTEHQDRPSMAIYQYLSDDQLKVTFYNRNQAPTRITDYVIRKDTKTGTAILQSSGTAFVEASFLNAQSTSISHSSWDPADDLNKAHWHSKSDIDRYLIYFDDYGHEEIVCYANNYNKPVSDSDAIYGISYQRDTLGRIETMRYLTITSDASYASDKSVYFPRNVGLCGRRYTYDEMDRLCQITYLGPDDQPILNEQGWMICVLDYEDSFSFNPSRESYLNTKGNLLRCNSGYAYKTFNYTTNGLVQETAFFDHQGNPTPSEDSYSLLMEYDENGYLSLQKPLGSDGQEIFNPDLYIRYVNDSCGNPIQTFYYYAPDVHRVELTVYDDSGRKIRLSLDQENSSFFSIYNSSNYGLYGEYNAICADQWIYNETTGLLESIRFLNEHGKPATSSNGCSGWNYQYDIHSNVSFAVNIGQDGEILTVQNGYAAMRITFDDSGRLLSTEYLDEQLQPCNDIYGVSKTSYTYDPLLGLEIRKEHRNKDGALVFTPDAYAYCTSEYDTLGNMISYAIYKEDGSPAQDFARLYSRWTAVYDGSIIREKTYFDDMGNFDEIEYYDDQGILFQKISYQAYDESGTLINGAKGYAYEISEYDALGNHISLALFAPDGSPAFNDELNYASCDSRYDGTVMRQANYYDIYGNLLRDYSYDENGIRRQLVQYSAYTENGELTIGPDGFAYSISKYDEHQNEISCALFAADGSPVYSEHLEYASWEAIYEDVLLKQKNYFDTAKNLLGVTIYNEQGKRIQSMAYLAYNENGELITGPEGYAYELVKYNENEEATEISLLAPDGSLASETLMGFSRLEQIYNDGLLSQISFFDANLNLVGVKNFDVNGRITEEFLYVAYNEKGELIAGPYGYAFEVCKYDDLGNIISLAFYAPDKSLVFSEQLGYARVEAFYEGTRRTNVIFYDENGNILNH